MIGLVGHSGAGKSTLVNLVCRFFDVAGGALLVDGRDIRSYRVADYRRHADDSAKLVRVGESKSNPKLDKSELAAWTTVASMILNLDETITKE